MLFWKFIFCLLNWCCSLIYIFCWKRLIFKCWVKIEWSMLNELWKWRWSCLGKSLRKSCMFVVVFLSGKFLGFMVIGVLFWECVLNCCLMCKWWMFVILFCLLFLGMILLLMVFCFYWICIGYLIEDCWWLLIIMLCVY